MRFGLIIIIHVSSYNSESFSKSRVLDQRMINMVTET